MLVHGQSRPLLAALLVAAHPAPAQPHPAGPPLVARVALAAEATPDGEWRMAARDPANTRFSPLADLHAGNVKDLRLAWTFDTGVARGQEAAPLVVGGTMYVVTPFPNHVFALDLARPGAPVRWRYSPPVVRAARGVACCDVVNRGMAFDRGRLFLNTLDGQTVALDAATGKELWRTQLGNIHAGETVTMAPVVVKGKVLVGNSGGEFGVRGWIAALDAATGALAWKAFSTGPDRDVGIGAAFRPFYPSDRGADLGVHTWPPEAWKIGGGTVWGWISWDPELDLVYHGTANPGPWNPDQRPGDNKWTAGVFARRPDTGEAIWFYQWTPHDLFDHDGVNESVVLDLELDGRPRKVLVHPERNGFVYVLDRATGEVLSAKPFVHVTAAAGVDPATGRLVPRADKHPTPGKVVRDVCPAAPGAKDWQPSAWSPRTGLLYIPHQNLCMDWESLEANYIAGTPYVGANARYKPGPGGHMGELTAWDPVKGEARWKLTDRFPIWSGALATAGDLVFFGTLDGWFKAVSARDGRLLWQWKLGSGIIGQPVTYRAPDGRQYVSILAGVGGWPGLVVLNHLDSRDQTAAAGWGQAMRDLPGVTGPGGTLYTFGLP